MNLACWLAMAIPLLAMPPTEPTPRARASITTKGDIWAGQRVTMVIELLSPSFFTGTATIDLPKVPGLLILKPEERAVVGSEEIDGATYTTQRHEFALFPQRGGAVQLPAFPVRFAYSGGPGKPSIDAQVMTPPLAFTAKMPPGAERLATVLTTRDLKLTENWKPEPPKTAKVGDAFTRTITLEASDLPGMVLPNFPTMAGEEMTAYPRPPEVADHLERGDLTGRRVEVVTYVCQHSGSVVFPPLTLTWWDPSEQKLKQARLPGHKFYVSPGASSPPEGQATTPPSAPERSWLWEGIVIVAVLAILFVGPIVVWWRREATTQEEAEPESFRQFQSACQRQDLQAMDRTLRVWLDHVSDRAGTVCLDEFANRFGDARLLAMVAELEARLYGRNNVGNDLVWSGSALETSMTQARHRLLHSVSKTTRLDSTLAPLNPAS